MSRRSGGSGSGSGKGRRERPAIEVSDLVKHYGDVVALEVDELEVPQGQSVVLVGHNGSGKSTLLSILAGTLEASEGRVRVEGEPPDSMIARAGRSWLPDNPVLYDDLSVREHLEYTSRMHGGDGEEPLLAELVERLGLSGREDDLPSQFSRGLRQKTAVAIALCRPFSILLVDEPFVGLDTSGRAAFLELLSQARDEGATIVVATHDPAVIEQFERGIVLDNGEVIHDGPASELPAFLSADAAHRER